MVSDISKSVDQILHKAGICVTRHILRIVLWIGTCITRHAPVAVTHPAKTDFGSHAKITQFFCALNVPSLISNQWHAVACSGIKSTDVSNELTHSYSSLEHDC